MEQVYYSKRQALTAGHRLFLPQSRVNGLLTTCKIPSGSSANRKLSGLEGGISLVKSECRLSFRLLASAFMGTNP